MAFKLAVTDDWFRSEICGLESHLANRQTIEGFLFPLANYFDAIIHRDAIINTQRFKTEALRSLDLSPDISGWLAAQDAQPTEALLSLVAEECRDLDLIVGWGLPNIIKRVFMRCGIKFLSVQLSPLRFAQDYFWSIQTNISECSEYISTVSTPDIQLLASAAELCAFHRRRSTQPFDNRKFALIFGQTAVDSNLCHRGSLAHLREFVPQMKEWMREFEVIYYREHPHGDGSNLATMRSLGCVETSLPPYQLLSDSNLSACLAISSGITFEAPFFGVSSTRLIAHPYYETRLDGIFESMAVPHGGLVQLLVRILDPSRRRVSKVGRKELDGNLRNVFGNPWGDRFARSDNITNFCKTSSCTDKINTTTSIPKPALEKGIVEPRSLTYADIVEDVRTPLTPPPAVPLTSGLCQERDFVRPGYRYWCHATKETPRLHRKQWEFYFIAQALHERGLLEAGRTGLGFGVGREPLVALFAKMSVAVLASDQGIEEAVRAGWAKTHEHAANAFDLNDRGICPPDRFSRNVSFREIDMNDIPEDLSGKFDFCWSACCFEHLGSLQHGMDFVAASIETLKVGGVAVHTTEYNLSSNEETIETPGLSVYRRKDIERLVERLERAGHRVAPIDWSGGGGVLDGHIDLPPYRAEPHLRLRLANFDCTSIGLIIVRGR